MSVYRNPFRPSRDGIRRISLIEFVLAVSVIVGFVFVSVRIKTMGFDGAGWHQAAAPLVTTPADEQAGADPATVESIAPSLKAELQPNPTSPAQTKSP